MIDKRAKNDKFATTVVVSTDPWQRLYPLLLLVGMIVVLMWCYWTSLTRTAHYWENAKYSNGYLVPLFVGVLLWLRKDSSLEVDSEQTYLGIGLIALGLTLAFASQESYFPDLGIWLERGQFIGVTMSLMGLMLLLGGLPAGNVAPSARWAGVGLLSFGLLVRIATNYWPNISPELASFVPCVAGLVLLVGGWAAIKWAGPPVAFLIFMFPLPGVLDGELLQPLQRFATICSRYVLQTIGIACFNEGNTIHIGETSIGIVDACSGLRMLTMFIAMSVAVTMVTDRPIWERVVIMLSSVPIALSVNVIRITVTGILCMIARDPDNALGITEDLAKNLGHDMAGWIMMPLALGMLYVETQILSHLVTEELPAGGMPIGLDVRRTRRGRMLGS